MHGVTVMQSCRAGGAAEGSPQLGTSPARGPVAGHHNRDSLEEAFVNLAVSRPPPVAPALIPHKVSRSASCHTPQTRPLQFYCSTC